MSTIEGRPPSPEEETIRTEDGALESSPDLTLADRKALVEAREMRAAQREADLDERERQLAETKVGTSTVESSIEEDVSGNDRNVASTFAEIATDLFSAGELSEVLRRIVEVANAVVEGCDLASVTLLEGEKFSTPVYTHTNALRVDEVQYSTGEGPCIEALLTGTVHGTAPGWREQWPDWAARAEQVGVQSVLAVPLRIPNTIHLRLGAVNMYSRFAHGFSAASQEMALVLSAHAAIAAVVARERNEKEHQERTFQEALSSRDVIGQAKGMLMERHRITADEAFAALRRSSQGLNSKLRDVAHDLVRGKQED